MRTVLITAVLAAMGLQALDVEASSTPIINKQVTTSAKVKVSKAIRDLPTLQKITPQRKTKLTKSGELVPGVDLIKEVPNHFPFATKLLELQKGKDIVDPVLQTKMLNKGFSISAPDMGANFDGMTNPQGYVPPDTNGSVGPNHYVQTVNVSLAIWDKTGTELVAPVAINSLWAGFGGICESNNNGDPIVMYDRRADRWMISQFALASNDNHQCIAVSQTADPTGAYFLYDFPYGALMNDYPHFGIFGDAYYMGVNQFGDSGWAGGGVAAYERDAMLVGAVAQQVIISGQGMSPEVFTPMPLDVDGIAPPPADMNQLFLWANGSGQSKLHVFEMDLDWSDAAGTTFTEVADLDVAAFASPSNATQPNGEELDALGIRSMFRTSYRNLDGEGKILFTHNIAGPNGQPVARWYQLDVDHANSHAVTVNQTGTFSPDSALAPSSAARWMVSGAMDANGNIAIGYTVSGANNFPSIHAATRLASDPAGTLTDEFVLVEGGGSQGAVNRGRWADYASMSIDPVDDCTFWYTNEYYKAENNNTLTWSTRVSSFKIPTCTTGPSGEISGTVTDSASGDPLANVTVSAGNLSAVTNESGDYSMVLPVGDYDLDATRYGWVSVQQPTITVGEDAELTSDFALAAAEAVELMGTVTDGSGQGWPLYAKVSATVPGDTIVTYTNPETGEYVLPVFEGTTINLSVRSEEFDGYAMTDQDVLPTADVKAPMALDFTLMTDSACTAPGYQFVDPSFVEDFNGGTFPPTGWTVSDDEGNGVVWGSALAGIGNITGTTGDAALANSDAGGSVDTDTSLMTPVINVADLNSTTLAFVANFRTYTGADQVDLDINVDGAGWVNVRSLATGNSAYSEDLSAQLAGATSFQLRWRYFNANWEWYVSIDDVTIGDSDCVPLTGNVVSGYVNDANTGLELNNVNVVVNGMNVSESGMTEDDSALGNGFVNFFVPTDGTIAFEANRYETKTSELADVMLATPISINAGIVSSDTATVETSVTLGRTATQSINLSNTGTASATYNVVLIDGIQELSYGPFDQQTRHMGPKDMNLVNAKKIRYFPDMSNVESLTPGELADFFPAPTAFGIAVNRKNGTVWNGEAVALGAGADVARRYEADGTPTADVIDTNFGGAFAADMAINQRTGMIWQLDVAGGDCIHELDPTTMTQTGSTICPQFGTSQRGLAYDPVSDTYYAGSWNDSTIHQFTSDGTIIRSVNTSLPIAGLAYNAGTQHLLASINAATGNFDIVVMDATSSDLVKVGGYDLAYDFDGDGTVEDLGGDNGQAGLDLDCNGVIWMNDMNYGYSFGVESTEQGACDWMPSWLSTEANGTLAVGADGTFELAMDFSVGEEAIEGVDVSLPVDIAVDATNGDYRDDLSQVFVYEFEVLEGSTAIDVAITESTSPDFDLFLEFDSAGDGSYALVASAATATALEVISYDAPAAGQYRIIVQNWEGSGSATDSGNVDVTVSTPAPGGDPILGMREATIIILNDTPYGSSSIPFTVDVTAPEFGSTQFAVTHVEVDEKDNALLTVTRTGGSDFAVSVDFSTIDGSAVAGTDYTATSGTLTWGDMDTAAKTISVPTLELDVHKTFTVTLKNAQGGSSVGASSAMTVTINDKPKGGGSFGAPLLMLFAFAGLLRRRKALVK